METSTATQTRPTLQVVVYYYKPHRFWYGYWADEWMNQVGESLEAVSRDDVLIELGAVRDERVQMLMEQL